MIETDEIFPFVVAIAVSLILFFSFITLVKKSMKPAPRKDTIDSKMNLKEQRWRMDDIRQRQKQLMRDQKQKMRDLRR